jgi:peptidoglycan/LPS O-acetylase OafA/YrhL
MTAPADAAPPRRLDSLTSLRFFAAAAVVILHLSLQFALPETIGRLAGLGYVAVAFFFALSGFVLAWTAGPADTARRFYGRRFARIWPPHATVTALTIPVIYLAGGEPVWGALPFVLTFTQVWIPSPAWHYAFNGPSWSLGAEAFFYVLFPALINVARAHQQRLRHLAAVTIAMMAAAALAVVLVVPDTAWGFLLYLNPLYRLGEFALGMLLALAVRRGWRAPWPTWVPVVAGAAVYVALVAFAPHDSEGAIPRILADSALLPFLFAIIAAAATADIRGRETPLRSRTLRALGDRSFALYLIHVPLITAGHAILAGRTPGHTAGLALAIGLLAASVGAAHLLYVAVERPAERRLRLAAGRPRAINRDTLQA